MPSTMVRRPLPALIFLIALTVLTALVWWRVLSRGDGGGSASTSCPSTAPSSSGEQVLPTQSSVTVQVLNATRRSGIAKAATDALRRDGFHTVPQDNDPKSRGKIPGVAEIRYGSDQAAAAKLLSYYFPRATLKKTSGTDGKVIVALGKRYKRVVNQTTVEARLERDGISLRAQGNPAPSGSASSTC